MGRTPWKRFSTIIRPAKSSNTSSWPGKTREEYLADHTDQETEYGNIYALYMIRGNREKALEYLNRIRNPKERFNKPSEPA